MPRESLFAVLALAMGICTQAASAEPDWFRTRYAALIEIADTARGSEQIEALAGRNVVEGLDELLIEGWRLMPGIDPKPIVRASSPRSIRLEHLVREPSLLPAITSMFESSTAKNQAVDAVLDRVCKLPGAYILGLRSYRFDYVFWTPTLRTYGPLAVDLSNCIARSPFVR